MDPRAWNDPVIILARHLEKDGQPFTVEFAQPVEDETGSYFCAIRVQGLNQLRPITAIYGVDETHARDEALKWAGRVFTDMGGVTRNGSPDLGLV
ncbi:hypothetical protein IU453_22640 [Nocardia cyriacigeorgica]|uniref:hypothetical protein n=1 Tax=Nocardia cyriacigeorgica TaxID=135487 RepID=UPI0018936866|nr:hypothetical protein [Nocardia cyriacigeorgica]MBF6319553.1 hypothetical protein [Nocardia cyriacigeorgica]MBF6343633.1 hypothetical protein [Nocardia cyriacigeorgica]MBF6533663.1 hypothetical protein [Nocardia cyriacigeorgica]